MASIDLMREKGVYDVVNDVVSPMKEFNHSDSEPIWRQNGYQLDFSLATGGNINYNGTDYPQNSLITSFEAEGKTWLLGESTGVTIESETGEFATISINESLTFLDSTVWEKKPFALVGNGTTDKIVFPGLSEIVLTATPLVGGFTQLGKIYNLTEGLGNEVFSNGSTYSLVFDMDNSDQLTSADLYPISSSGLFFVEITIDTSRFMAGFPEAIIGNMDENGPKTTQWLLQKSPANQLRFYHQRSYVIDYDDFITDFPSDVVTIRGEWDDSGIFLYVNGDLKATTATVRRPSTPTTPVLVCGRNGLQPANFTCYEININDEHIWKFDEIEGFISTSDSGRILTGSTDHANGLDYWNDDVRNVTNEVTVGTIETSHAQGNEHINFGMWQKQNNNGNWIPYT